MSSILFRPAPLVLGTILLGTFAGSAQAQVGGAVRGAASAGVTSTVQPPRVTVPVGATTQASTSVAAQGAATVGATSRGTADAAVGTTAHVATTVSVQVRQAVDAGVQAMLASVELTARQKARLQAQVDAYARETQAAVRTAADAQARERAARFRGRVRGMLTASQQQRMDANVRAGATAEVDAR